MEVFDKLGQQINVGDKVVVVGGQGELQRMIVESHTRGGRIIKCRPTDEDSCAKVKKLFSKRADQSIKIDKLIDLLSKA